MVERPDIYSFVDYRAYLVAWVDAGAGRPSFRTLARKAGCSPALLSAVTHGQRGLAPGTATALAAAMELTGDHLEYFLKLIAYEQAESRAARALAYERLVAIRTYRRARGLADSAWLIFTRWYIPAVAELSRCEGFRPDPEWIAATLRPRIQPDQAAEALEVLVTAGMLRREGDGSYTPTDGVFASDHEVRGVAALAVAQMHHAVLQLAGSALDTLRAPDRHFTTLTGATSPEVFAEIKAAAVRFNEQILGKINADPGPRDRVIQVSLQVFPVSARPTEDGGE